MKKIICIISAFLLLASVSYSQKLGNRKALSKNNIFKGKVVQLCVDGGANSGCDFYLEQNKNYIILDESSFKQNSLLEMKDKDVEIFGFQMLGKLYISQIRPTEQSVEANQELPPVETDWRVLFIKFGYKDSPAPTISDEEIRAKVQYAFQTYKSYFRQLTLSEIVIKSTVLDKDMPQCTFGGFYSDFEVAAKNVGYGNSNIILGYGSNTNCQFGGVGQVKLTRQGDQAFSAYPIFNKTLFSIGHEVGHSKHNLQHASALDCNTDPVNIPQQCNYREFSGIYSFMGGTGLPILTKIEQYIIASQIEYNEYKKTELVLASGETKTFSLRRDLDKSIRLGAQDIVEIQTGGDFNYFVEFKPQFFRDISYLYGIYVYVGPPINVLRPVEYKLIYKAGQNVLFRTLVNCFPDKPGETFTDISTGISIKPRCDISTPRKLVVEVSRQ